MPVIFYGDAKDGQPFRRPADVILRRVNDVPGSTEAQRRWHIERIEWKERLEAVQRFFELASLRRA